MMPKAKRRPKAAKKTAEAPSPLREIVGDDVYDAWVRMLKKLVPDGRIDRLAVLVASMLAYASSIARSSRGFVDENDPEYPLRATSKGADEEEVFRLLQPMLVQLFKDARVKYERVSSRGEEYSILWEATIEFCRWYKHPWQG